MTYKLPALIAFFLLLGGASVWIGIALNQNDPLPPSSTSSSSPSLEKPKTQEEWFYAMAKNKQEGYSYPINEMMLKYNFHHGVEPLRVFIDDLSEYRFYCINQVLIKNKIEYAYYKTDKVIQLIVFLNDQNSQKKILADFDYYQIKYTLQK